MRGLDVDDIGSVTLIKVAIGCFSYSIADEPRIATLTEYNPGVNPYADN
jgi:hypothetical protein